MDLDRAIVNTRLDLELDAWAAAFSRGKASAESYPLETWKRRYYPEGSSVEGPVVVMSTGGGDFSKYWQTR